SPGAAAGASFAKAGTDINAGTSGALSFAAGSHLAIAINGTTPDTQYDQLNVTGNADLTGVDLLLSGIYSPKVGDEFMVVNVGDGGVLTGYFNNLSEGKIFSIPSGPLKGSFSITYHGGDGNDVVLTALNDAPSFTKGADQIATDEGSVQASIITFAGMSSDAPDT